MKILVINCGSSSLKYQLFDMTNESVLAKGLVERIGIEGSILIQKIKGKETYTIEEHMSDHKAAIRFVLGALVDEKHGVIKNMDEITAVGHRVVHAGEYYSTSVLINDEVMKALEDCIKLAPLHNPPNIIGINACKALMPETPMVAVFDTAFHQTMPEEAFIYAIPYELYSDYKIRRYGFHGTSHKYVSQEAAKLIGKDLKDIKMITCHLGNGASVTAIKNGVSVDTSMGFTPLEGVAMGTRSGNLDPAIVTFLIKELKYTAEQVDTLLNRKSGVLGISGVSSDFRDLIKEAGAGNNRAKLAIDVFCYKVKQFIGSYAAVLGGVDCIIFTAGVGENNAGFRAKILSGLEFLGVNVDAEANSSAVGVAKEISTADSKTKAFAIPTDEEVMIARDTLSLVINN